MNLPNNLSRLNPQTNKKKLRIKEKKVKNSQCEDIFIPDTKVKRQKRKKTDINSKEAVILATFSATPEVEKIEEDNLDYCSQNTEIIDQELKNACFN